MRIACHTECDFSDYFANDALHLYEFKGAVAHEGMIDIYPRFVRRQ
jgi:hypothetical protein